MIYLNRRRFPVLSRKLIYICGMGHNGSTILNLILGQDSNVVATSQLNDLLHPYDPRTVDEFKRDDVDRFWLDVLNSLTPEEVAELQAMHSSCRQERKIHRALFSGRHRKRFSKIGARLANVVMDLSEKTVLVDSSKNISRALALSSFDDVEVFHLHLIRDVRGLVNSHNKRRDERNWKRVYAKSTFWWLFKNTTASLFTPFVCKNRLQLKYEDLVMNPDKALDTLEAFVGEEFPQARKALRAEVDIAASKSLGFSGNRVITREKNRFRSGQLSTGGVFKSNLYWFSLGWLSMFWGYRRKARASQPIPNTSIEKTS